MNDIYRKLGDIADIKQGRYLAKEDMAEAQSAEHPVPVHGANGIIGWTNRAMYETGVPLVTCRGSNSGMVLWASGPLWVSNNAMAIIPRGGDLRFAYYCLLNAPPYDTVSGSAQPQITRTALAPRLVFWPDLDQQTAIADALSAFDDKIELNQRMNETLEAMAQAIFRDWFIHFGPVRRKLAGESDPIAVMGWLTPDLARATELAALFPAGFGEDGLPKGWLAGAVGDLIEFNPKEPLKKGALAPYSDMSSLPTIGSTADLPIMREFGSGMRFRNGDALLARITPCLENGKTALIDFLTDESPVGWGSTEFIVHRARPGTPRALPYLLCRNDDYRGHAIQSMTGTSGRQRAQVESLAAWPIAVPTRSALDAFSGFVDAFFDRISANARENRTLAEARDYLLPRLISGAVRVGDLPVSRSTQ